MKLFCKERKKERKIVLLSKVAKISYLLEC